MAVTIQLTIDSDATSMNSVQRLSAGRWVRAMTVPTVFCHNRSDRLTTQILHDADKYPPKRSDLLCRNFVTH